MKARPFYRWKGFWLGVVGLGLAMMVGVLAFVPLMGAAYERPVLSPSGEFVVNALPFHGEAARGYEGGLIVYLSDRNGSRVVDRHQTSLKGTRGTRLEWVAGAQPESFRVWDEEGTRMVWRVEGKKMICVEGMGFLVGEGK